MTKRHHLVPRFLQPGKDANVLKFSLDSHEEQFVQMSDNPVVNAPTSTFFTLLKGQHETVPHFLFVAFDGTIVYDPSRNHDNETVDGSKYFEYHLDSRQSDGTVADLLIKLYITVDTDTPPPTDPDDHPSSGTDQGDLGTRPADNNTVGVTVYPGHHVGDELFDQSGLINTTNDEAKAFAFAYSVAIDVYPNSHKPSTAPSTTPVKTSELLGGDIVETVYTTTANASLYHLDHKTGVLTFVGDHASIPLSGNTVTVQIRAIYTNDTTKTVYTVVNEADVTVTRQSELDTARDTDDFKNHVDAVTISTTTVHESHLPWWVILLVAVGLVLFLAVIGHYLMNRK